MDTNQHAEMLPMFLKLEGRPCLVVGAGNVAAPKVASLLRAGGDITVVAPDATPELASQAEAGELQWQAREFVESDLDGKFLVITGTNKRSVNHAVAVAARARGILVNSVDDPPDCDFFYPSVVRRGDLQIAISTAGKSPALAQRLREEIDALLGEDTGEWLDRLGEMRLRILEAFPATVERKKALHLLARRERCEPETCPVQLTLNKLIGDRLPSNAPGSTEE
jgi:precorrin-2 dehydrogenase/sirohydrochlorin ferrochelatase